MGGSKGPDKQTKAAEQKVADESVAIAESQNKRADQLFTSSFPGFQKSEDYYTKLSTGDPNTIATAISPATQQISAATEAAKKNITANTPRGGAQDLALEEADVNAAGQKGQVATNSYLGSFPALAALSGQGIGLSTNDVQSALSAFGSAQSGYGNIANQEAQGKAQTLGFFGSLGGAAASGAGMAICWIAESLFGVDAYETSLLRYWLYVYYRNTVIGSYVYEAYRKYGQSIAPLVRERGILRSVFMVIFKFAVNQAKHDLTDLDRAEIKSQWSLIRAMREVRV
jgi:hypothetical protein